MEENDLKLELTASLDETQSRLQLNQDIEAIKNSLKELALKAELDPEQLNSLETKLNSLTLNLNHVNFTQTALKSLAEQITLTLKEIPVPDITVNSSPAAQTEAVSSAAEESGGESNTILSTLMSTDAITGKVISLTTDALSELQEIDSILTEIGKSTNSLSHSQLTDMGDNAFDTASRYGKTATAYLSDVQEAYGAGYTNAEEIAELSIAAQTAGDMTAELANRMIYATDNAYELGGSVTRLKEILDGMHYITKSNDISMTDLSEAMSAVGSTAASFGIQTNELAAALGTMSSVTQQSGSDIANAFHTILLYIQQVSDEEHGITTEGLTRYEEACHALGVSLKDTKDGITGLRDPMEVLKELSSEYNKLVDTDSKKTELLDVFGNAAESASLDALLSQWDTYETMLQQYADGTGSMSMAAENTLNTWEGSLTRLSNTWTDTVQNVANSDGIITAINGLNGLLSVINTLTGALGPLGTIGAGAGLFTGLKNIGKRV